MLADWKPHLTAAEGFVLAAKESFRLETSGKNFCSFLLQELQCNVPDRYLYLAFLDPGAGRHIILSFQ